MQLSFKAVDFCLYPAFPCRQHWLVHKGLISETLRIQPWSFIGDGPGIVFVVLKHPHPVKNPKLLRL